jgi:putative DNA primase/helicase
MKFDFEEIRRPFEEESPKHTNGSTHPDYDHKGLVELIINESDPTATAKELAALVATRNDFLFNGNAPVRIAVEAGKMPRAIKVTVEAVRVLAHELCVPVKTIRKKDNEQLVRTKLSEEIARIYLWGLEGRWGLKPFHGITTAPVLKHDGSMRFVEGYDPESGLWCCTVPELNSPERPTEADARAALQRLRGWIRTFPFGDAVRIEDKSLDVEVVDITRPPGLDESTFLTGLLTSVCRQSLEHAPALLLDAPVSSGSGTGKGLAVRFLCIVANGVGPSAFTSGHDANEFDKRLTSALIEAHPAVFLDNFNNKELKSDTLASALTENPAMVRVFGQTKMVPLHTRTFVSIIGNGLEIAEDMARRVLKCHLDAKMENPEERKFEPGFLDRVSEARPAVLSDVLTVWRWGRQTVLKPGKPLGSFERWAQWCRDPLLMLGCRDPVERIAEIKANDPRRRALADFFEVWWVAHGDNVVRANEVASEVIEAIDEKACRKGDGSLQYSRQRVASYIRSLAGTRVGGYVFTKLADDGVHTRPVAQYRLQRKEL